MPINKVLMSLAPIVVDAAAFERQKRKAGN
jgi:hypothetical protein